VSGPRARLTPVTGSLTVPVGLQTVRQTPARARSAHGEDQTFDTHLVCSPAARFLMIRKPAPATRVPPQVQDDLPPAAPTHHNGCERKPQNVRDGHAHCSRMACRMSRQSSHGVQENAS
jgi:hypothetical protein